MSQSASTHDVRRQNRLIAFRIVLWTMVGFTVIRLTSWHALLHVPQLHRHSPDGRRLAQTIVNLQERSLSDQAATALTHVASQNQRFTLILAILAFGVIAHFTGSALLGRATGSSDRA